MADNTDNDFLPTAKTRATLSKVTKRVYEQLSNEALSRGNHIVVTQCGRITEKHDKHVDSSKKLSRFFGPPGALSNFGGMEIT